MPDIYSFLQTVYQFVKSLAVNMTKKMYRTAAVFTTGAAVVTVVMFNSGDFSGAGKNAAVSLYGDSEESEDLTDERRRRKQEMQRESAWNSSLPLQTNRASIF